MNNGWITLHRKLKEKGFYQRSAYVHLWIHLLLSANHEEKEFLWNGKTITIKPGQFITGAIKLSKATNIPQTTVERILTFFSNDAQIGVQKTNKYRLITILNWESYQKADFKRISNGFQADTNNNINNINNKDFVPKSPFKEKTMKKNSFNYNENNSSDSYEDEIDLETGEVIVSTKTKKEPKNKLALALGELFSAMCKKEIGIVPVKDKKTYFTILNALKYLDKKQIIELYKDWFSSGESEENLIQITRALSNNQINKFKVSNGIKN